MQEESKQLQRESKFKVSSFGFGIIRTGCVSTSSDVGSHVFPVTVFVNYLFPQISLIRGSGSEMVIIMATDEWRSRSF